MANTHCPHLVRQGNGHLELGECSREDSVRSGGPNSSEEPQEPTSARKVYLLMGVRSCDSHVTTSGPVRHMHICTLQKDLRSSLHGSTVTPLGCPATVARILKRENMVCSEGEHYIITRPYWRERGV